MTDDSALKSKFAILTTTQHDRDVVGFKYVYPVVSRRARGLSIGINLNPNNACNWRCVYCQVEGLTRGAAPQIDLGQLAQELATLCTALESGDFLERHVALEYRRVADLAISGNGEPTGSPQFGEVLELLAQLRVERAILRDLPVVLITNGSLADRPSVQQSIRRLAALGGTVWFKLDAGTDAGIRQTNSASTSLHRHLNRLIAVARLCPTYVQSCWFCRDRLPPDAGELAGYIAALESLRAQSIPIRGVQLYTLARQSLQPEADRLGPVSNEWLTQLAAKIASIGFAVEVAP